MDRGGYYEKASNVQFAMKNGMAFKRDGVMTPEKFFHPGPVKIPNGRWTR